MGMPPSRCKMTLALIEVAIRRSNRLIEPLREGDRVQLTAQMKVFRDRENIPVLICVEATAIQHLGQ